MITAICILSLVVAILLYTNYNLLKKFEAQEDVVISQETILTGYLGYIDSLSKTIDYANEKLQKIDANGTFASDDEIGWFFTQLLSLQAQLNNFRVKTIKIENGNGNQEESEKE